jgi:hypothetical protein
MRPAYQWDTPSVSECVLQAALAAGWLGFVGLALAISFLEAATRGAGVTRERNWRVAPKFRPILGLAGVG